MMDGVKMGAKVIHLAKAVYLCGGPVCTCAARLGGLLSHDKVHLTGVAQWSRIGRGFRPVSPVSIRRDRCTGGQQHPLGGVRIGHRLWGTLDGLHGRLGLGTIQVSPQFMCAAVRRGLDWAACPCCPSAAPGAHVVMTLLVRWSSQTRQEGAFTFSKGIWKSVYLVGVSHVAITHMVPHVFYLGEYPATMLKDGSKGDFEVRVRVHTWATGPGRATLNVSGAWGEHDAVPIQYPAGESNTTVVLKAAANSVKLWWPLGVGAQPLYQVRATLTSAAEGFDGEQPLLVADVKRRVGFRHVALVTGNDTDPAFVKRAATEEGTELHGMMFRVNGAAIFARGANVIPTEELEGWYSAAVHAALVQNAAEAGMNMLRVWGGGIYLPQVSSRTCGANPPLYVWRFAPRVLVC